MTSLSRFEALPQNMFSHILSFHDDPGVIPCISKKIFTMWQKRGVEAIASLPEKYRLGRAIGWKEVRPILQNWADDQLFSGQTILSPIAQIDLRKAVYYRSIPQMHNLHKKIISASKEYLDRFSTWHEICSHHIQETPAGGSLSDPTSQNFLWIQAEFNKLFAPDPGRPLAPPYAAPVQLLECDVRPSFLDQALIHSAQHHQIPFIKALVTSQKASRISVESWETALSAICYFNVKRPNIINPQFKLAVLTVSCPHFRHNGSLQAPLKNLLRLGVYGQNFTDFLSAIDTFLKHPSLSIPEACAAVNSTIGSLARNLPEEALLEYLKLILASNKINSDSANECLDAILSTSSMTLESRLKCLSFLLEHPKIGPNVIARTFSKIVRETVEIPSEAFMDVLKLLLQNVHITKASYIQMYCALKNAPGRLSQDTIGQIQSVLFAHPLATSAFTEHLWNLNKYCEDNRLMEWVLSFFGTVSNSDINSEWLSALGAILQQPHTNSSRLWRYFSSVVGPYQSHDTYRTSLRMIASHPHAAQMPLAVRLMIAFERAWAWVTFPIHGTFTFLFGWKVAQVITSLLLLPITLLRVLGAAFLHLAVLYSHLAVLYSNPSR